MRASSWLLVNESLGLAFAQSAHGAILVAVHNRLSHRHVTFSGHDGFLLVVGEAHEPVRQAECQVVSQEIDDAAGTLKERLRHETTGLAIAQEVALHGPVARLRLRVRNDSAAAVLLRDVTFLDARTSERVRQGQTGVDLSRGDPGAFEVSDSRGTFDAAPLFVGDDLFLGVDWPVAENACRGAAIVCRQFPGRVLAPGEEWLSRTFSIGVAAPGEEWLSRTFSIGVAAPGDVAHAFVAHLDALRGRPPRRASFYFDWLLHASEGPAEDEVAATLAFFRRLRDEHGVQFDLYALDDGAVETRWAMMRDRYRLQHERLCVAGAHGLPARGRRFRALRRETCPALPGQRQLAHHHPCAVPRS